MMSQCGIIASDMSDAPIKFHIAVYGFSSIQAAIAGMCGARNLYIYSFNAPGFDPSPSLLIFNSEAWLPRGRQMAEGQDQLF